MRLGDFGFPEPTLIRLLPGGEVHCCICDIPGTISRVSYSFPNVVGVGAAATRSVWDLITAETFPSDIPYYLSRSQM